MSYIFILQFVIDINHTQHTKYVRLNGAGKNIRVNLQNCRYTDFHKNRHHSVPQSHHHDAGQ